MKKNRKKRDGQIIRRWEHRAPLARLWGLWVRPTRKMVPLPTSEGIAAAKKMMLRGQCSENMMPPAMGFDSAGGRLACLRREGFSIIRPFMRCGTVAGVHREIRSDRGRSTAVLVISRQDSAKRIVIPVRFFDQIKLTQGMAVLARNPPGPYRSRIVRSIQPMSGSLIRMWIFHRHASAKFR
jgi:hypothetical protein